NGGKLYPDQYIRSPLFRKYALFQGGNYILTSIFVPPYVVNMPYLKGENYILTSIFLLPLGRKYALFEGGNEFPGGGGNILVLVVPAGRNILVYFFRGEKKQGGRNFL